MNWKIEPWAHQKEAIERAREVKHFALFFEPGTGKTGTTINILREKFNGARRLLRTLIFCPPLVVPNWRDEWKKHSDIDLKNVILLQGTGSKRLKTFLANSSSGKVFITNYESLLMRDLFEAFQTWKPEALVYDESHRLKSPQSKRSKLADTLSNPILEGGGLDPNRPLCYLLSGSPVLNSPMDLFQQFLVLDGGKAFGRNYFAFCARYFRDCNSGMPKDRYFPRWEPMTLLRDGVDALSEINAIVAQNGMRVEKKDCLDLPPEVSVTLKVGMTPTQTRLYLEMKKDFVTYLGDQACVATLAIVKALRLLQITAGFLGVEGQESDPTVVSLEATPKEEALEELLEELAPHSKVIVWAVWKENYGTIKRVCERLGLGFVEVHGGVSQGGKENAVKAFTLDQSIRVFIGHPGSGGIGINLTCAPYSIFYSRTFSLEHFLQARARNHRGGSREAGHEKITHYDLVCEGTIDELVTEKLANKIDLSERLLKDLAREMASGSQSSL